MVRVERERVIGSERCSRRGHTGLYRLGYALRVLLGAK